MARPGITREEVFTTADALAHDGIQPTVKLVRDRIGGSFSTITPHLAAWKDERGGKHVANVPDMTENVTSACRSLWASAWKAGQDAIQTERDGLSSARREMEVERAELAQEITELERKYEALEGAHEKITSTLEAERAHCKTAEEELSRLRVEHARLEERVANTQARADELREQVARLEGELARVAQHTTQQKIEQEAQQKKGAKDSEEPTPDSTKK